MTTPGDRPGPADAGRPFAHASEAEFARILDFYRVPWEYEPHIFPLVWDLDGNVLESFAPDFYLPDMDLYVEMTTLQQRLVRKKNRKVRRLRELYPGVRIKLFYARDFRALMLKYGRFALAAELSGTTGQATPPRADRELSAAGPGLAPAPLGALEPATDEPATGEPAADEPVAPAGQPLIPVGASTAWSASEAEGEPAARTSSSAIPGSSATRSRRRRARLAAHAERRDRAAMPARTTATQ
ncbi:MAG: hypothetical protein ACXWNG_00705 [Candidatus Limnocylindrales bacterium]